MVARQLYVLGDGGVLAAEHEDIKFGVTGEDILHPVPCHMEGKADVPHLVIIRGEGEIVCQPVRNGFLQSLLEYRVFKYSLKLVSLWDR